MSEIQNSKIKMQNIYHMLTYAFQVLRGENYKKAAYEEDFEFVEDLLAAMLAIGIASQIKRGLGREYISQTESLSSPRGKINISATLKSQIILKRRLVCEFDAFSENAYVNQVIKTTALLLMRSGQVKQERKKDLKKYMLYFQAVDALNPHEINWKSINYNRNNATYEMLVNICRLAVEALLPATKEGPRKITQFKDEKLSLPRLFEKFVLEYYKRHYPGCDPLPAKIDWKTDDGVNDLLPDMNSDVRLEYNGKILIIETKFYGQILQRKNEHSNSKIRSGHLYQIFAYVKNKAAEVADYDDAGRPGDVSGILLYAKTDEPIASDVTYSMGGNKISVKTLDLNKDFCEIRSRLDMIIDEWLYPEQIIRASIG